MKALQESMIGVRKEVTDAFAPAMEKFGLSTAGVAASVYGLTKAIAGFAAVASLEHETDPTPVVESLMNRMA